MSENGNGDASVAKKARLENNDAVEEKDFDEETQKALEEIDATQNEIDSLNERKSFIMRSFFRARALIVLLKLEPRLSLNFYNHQRLL